MKNHDATGDDRSVDVSAPEMVFSISVESSRSVPSLAQTAILLWLAALSLIGRVRMQRHLATVPVIARIRPR